LFILDYFLPFYQPTPTIMISEVISAITFCGIQKDWHLFIKGKSKKHCAYWEEIFFSFNL
jgi:hypothetical protein